MGFFVQRQGFVSQRTMWASIAADLAANGMQVISVDGVASNASIGTEIDSVVLQATTAMDPLATDQPWRLCFKVTDVSVQAYAASPLQISDTGTIAVKSQSTTIPVQKTLSGVIGNAITNTLTEHFFYHKGIAGVPNWEGSLNYSDGSYPDLILSDDSAIPFSYVVSISDHGLVVATYIEGRDNEGCRHNWFCIQRAINPDGSIVATGMAPLFCLYSCSGGGSPNANTVDANGIMRFTVREADINAPTTASSAVAHTADSFAVMNPIQQVTFNENGRYDFRFPAGLNTHRHSYPYEIDMIGYGSADVSSHKVGIELQVYDEVQGDGTTPLLRKYRAFAANSPYNTGMRLFILESGGGV